MEQRNEEIGEDGEDKEDDRTEKIEEKMYLI